MIAFVTFFTIFFSVFVSFFFFFVCAVFVGCYFTAFGTGGVGWPGVRCCCLLDGLSKLLVIK